MTRALSRRNDSTGTEPDSGDFSASRRVMLVGLCASGIGPSRLAWAGESTPVPAFDFTDAESDFSALRFSGAPDMVVDHNRERQPTRANELRLNGLRRIENLLAHSRPAWHELSVDAGSTYTLSAFIESQAAPLPVRSLLSASRLSAQATLSAVGNTIEGSRAFARLSIDEGPDPIDVRLGLGVGSDASPRTRFSRAMLIRGDYVGEHGKWVAADIAYPNSKVSAVRYFSIDEAGNPIPPRTVDGLGIVAGDALLITIPTGAYRLRIQYDDLSTQAIFRSAEAGVIRLTQADFARARVRSIGFFSA